MRPSVIFLLTSTSTLLLPSAAAAQEQIVEGSQAAPAEEATAVWNDIIVTARRRDESVQDIPQVVNAVSSETIRKFNIIKFEEVQSVVPGLSLNTTGVVSRASLRGVTYDPLARTSGTVEFYLNEALVDANYLFKSVFDVQQIEVLRGPQGTLRGRSAPSGAMTVTTRRPDLSEVGGYVQMTGSHLGSVNVQGAFNLPLVRDELSLRVAAVYDETDLDGVESVNATTSPLGRTRGVRATLRWEPSSNFDAQFMYQFLREDLRYFDQVEGQGAGGVTGPPISAPDRLAVQDEPNRITQENQIFIGNVNFDFGGQRLSYVGSYSRKKQIDIQDLDRGNLLPGTPILQFRPPFLKPTNDQQTHELRLSSVERIGGFLDYIVGGFYSKYALDVLVQQPITFLDGAFGSPLAPDRFTFDPRYGIRSHVTLLEEQKELSAFGSVTLHVGNRTEITAGGRYISFRGESVTNVGLNDAIVAVPLAFPCAFIPGTIGSTYPGTCDFPAPVPAQPPILSKDRFNPFVYSASVSHRFTDDLMVYANIGSAWRRGIDLSASYQNPTDNQVLRDIIMVDPESSKSYEIGFKSSWFDRRLRINVSAFRQDYEGLIFRTDLVPYLRSPRTVQFTNFTVNTDARVTGVEAEISFDVTRQWNISGSFSYADGKIQNAAIPCRDSDADGVPDLDPVTVASFPAGSVINTCVSNGSISRDPLWNANIQTEYNFAVSPNVDGFVRGLLNIYPSNSRRSQGFVADSYAILNMYAGIRDPAGAWEVSAFAKNATGTGVQLSRDFDQYSDPPEANALFGPSGYRGTSYTPRFEAGLTVRYSFGSR